MRAADGKPQSFDVPADVAERSLQKFAAQSGTEIVFATSAVGKIRTNAVRGDYTPRQALERMVARTSLAVAEDARTGALMVHTAPAAPKSTPPAGSSAPLMKRRNTLALVGALLGFSLDPSSVAQAAAGAGTITGVVTNQKTGNGLEGARVEVPALAVSALVDQTGRYRLTGIPAGAHELVASYTGLDSARATVAVGAGAAVTRDLQLTSSIYMLDVFKVAGEREGNAAAITAQRNADNVKSVASMDAYGNLPNLSGGELALRLPGVTFADPGDETVGIISVRGMGAGMTTITIDDGLMSSFSAQNRQTRLGGITGAMFEQIEIIKGHTPDKGADSLGGTINFKTRSPLSMREKRRISYNASINYAPPFTEQVPLREKHRAHPLVNASYMEKFEAFGSDEANLAVAVNVFYSENVFGFFRSTRDFQQTDSQPAYLWDYRTMDNYNNRIQRSVNTKWDYRVSPNTLLKLSLIYNDQGEPARRQYLTRAFTGSATTVPNATTGIVPGAFTDRVTVVRPAAGSMIDVTSTMISREMRMRHADLAGEHIYGRFEFEWRGLFSQVRYRTLGPEGILVNRIASTGWILDRSADDLYPDFRPNGGLDFSNPANYRPVATTGLSTFAGDLQQHRVRGLKGGAKYRLPIERFPTSLKTGLDLREQTVSNWTNRRRWNYIGTDVLPTAPILLHDERKTGRAIPTWEAAQFIQNGEPTTPALWDEDRYFREMALFAFNNRVQETVTSAFVMAQGRFGQNGFLAGVRGEHTDTAAKAFVRNRVSSTAAEQRADPVGAALRDYGNNWRTTRGDYTKYFPSVHLNRNFTSNLKARASWSTSFSRPSMANALPTETVNETASTLTVGNPALLPQTAKNWDLAVEFYFEPSGSFTVGWFHKVIRDYIVSNREVGTIGLGPNNGFNGQYEGLTLLTSQNAGSAVAAGWEFSYIQQLRFLPGLLKTLSLNANYTIIDTHGTRGGTTYLGNGQVAGFIPRTANLSLGWTYRKFGTRILYNYTSENIRSYNAGQPSRNQFMMKRELINLGFTYRVSPDISLQLDINNAFKEPQRYYRGIPDQMESYLLQTTRWAFGVQGRF